MEPEQSLLGVVVAEDGLVGFLVARVEREVVGSLPAGLGPEAHRLAIRTSLSTVRERVVLLALR